MNMMKRKNYKRRLISYVIIWSVILSSLLLNSPKDIALSASGAPEIEILTPEADAVFNVLTVEFTGRISDDLTTPDKLPVKVFEQLGDSQQPIDITNEGKLTVTPQDQYANFSFTKEFSEGVHNLTFVVSDGDGYNNRIDRSITIKPTNEETTLGQVTSKFSSMSLFSEETDRPYMTKMYLIPRDAVDDYVPGETEPASFLPVEDMTRVPLDYILLIDVRSIEALTTSKPLITVSDDFKGTPDFIKSVELSDGMNANIYTFTPDELLPKTSYYVYLNPEFTNELGDKHIIPRFLKFTTVSANHQDVSDFEGNLAEVPDSARSLDSIIHGNYSNATSACNYCHSTHNGNNDKLDGGEFGNNVENLCMACHDGTTGTMIGPSIVSNSNNQHNQNSTGSCTSCHNPHTAGTKDNPNSLQRKEVTDESGSHFEAYLYKKSSTAEGKADDFSLCLSCHDGSADPKTGNGRSNIKQYYNDDTYIGQSGHNITATADSGSPLNGQLPCAECHETHGSNNINLLREKLGNDPTDVTRFTKTAGEWDISAQRDFCLSCHNDKTVLYGKKGISLDTGIVGHEIESNKACSECHSTSNSFVEAAHAPQKKK
jgi:predicted CXXCH cytochrome family protein